MITKAGVPSKKVVVGLSSYGRSFQMVKAGCIGPMCQYTGPKSGATPGRCTKTAGYIANAEINEIIASNDSAEKSFDSGSDSNILVYNNTQWVAYLDETTKSTRTEYYESLNMGGTTDWAVDLQSFQSDSSGYNDPFANEQIFYVDPSVWTEENPSMNCEAPCVLVLPDLPLPTGTVITRTYTTTLDVAWVTVSDVTETNGDVAPITTVTHILQETAITATPGTFLAHPN
jgi:chitinase